MTDSHNNLTHPKYRPDIDGLRAIAVLSVVGFHAFPRIITGGFIGVDIFFVISGYLISTIIFGSLERDSFSFTEFYGRRIRRIFPALATILITCFFAGWVLLFPDEFTQLGKHIAGGAGFVSNIILWNESGYFDNDSGTKPLLHLWSLGIEEQFYIIWPLLCWLAYKLRFNFLLLTVIVAAISFTINFTAYSETPVADFYSPQTRFWELLAGSVLAYLLSKKSDFFATLHNKFLIPNLLNLLGLGLIAAGLYYITKDSLFPGYLALLPVSGAVLIIGAGKNALINKYILSSKAFVWFGLISFPLYLWHWPLLSFARIIEGEQPDYSIVSVLVIISVILSWLTYRFIEKPLRFGANAKAKTFGLLAAITIIGGAGYYVYYKQGLQNRNYSEAVYEGDIDRKEFFDYMNSKFFPCTEKNKEFANENYIRCMQSKESPDKDVAIIGDSHAEHLFIGIAEQLPNLNVVYYQGDKAPFLAITQFKNIFDVVLESKTIKKVIINMHWGKGRSQVPENSTFEQELLKTADGLISSGKKVYITDGNPTFRFDANKCKAKRHFFNTQKCDADKKSVDDNAARYMQTLHEVVKIDPRITLIEINKYFCDESVCSMRNGNKILYGDSHHLNILGSKFIGEKIFQNNKF